jgi:hypothetical protein
LPPKFWQLKPFWLPLDEIGQSWWPFNNTNEIWSPIDGRLCFQSLLMDRTHFQSHFGNLQMAIEIIFNYLLVTNFQKGLEGIYVLICNIWIHILALVFPFEFCVFGYTFITTIVWNLGWVEVVKSLVKGNFFHILQKF